MLASELFGEKWIFEDREIKGVTIDSRMVEDGFAFICIEGFENDGHRFAAMAEEKGAAVIVAQKPVDADVPVVLYENTTLAMAKIAQKFYGEPQNKLKLIGITGTNGKTTVSYLIKKILEDSGKRVGIIGTNEILVGTDDVGIKSSTPTTPNALELAHIFAKMVEMGAEYVVMEVSSHALDLHRVDGLLYEVGVFTNLTRDHLDYHKTMENYFMAKKKLFDISKSGVVNCDDEFGRKIFEEKAIDIIDIGVGEKGLSGENIEISEKGVSFDVVFKGEKNHTELGISGMFSVYNGLCAIGAALLLGLDLDSICKSLSKASGVCGRLERVDVNADFSVIIDYAHTPDGLENVLNAVNSYKKGRTIAVFGCGGDRDSSKRPIMGEIGTRLADFAVITSDNPRTEEPKKIIADIVSGVASDNYKVIESRKEAIGYALSIAQKDDIVLLAGKGQETYQIIGREKTPFDEREIVREFLGE